MRARIYELLFLSSVALQNSAAIFLPHQTLSSVPAESHAPSIDAQQLCDGLSGCPETTSRNEPDFVPQVDQDQVVAYYTKSQGVKIIFPDDFGNDTNRMFEQMSVEAQISIEHLKKTMPQARGDSMGQSHTKDKSNGCRTSGKAALDRPHLIEWTPTATLSQGTLTNRGSIQFDGLGYAQGLDLMRWYRVRGTEMATRYALYKHYPVTRHVHPYPGTIPTVRSAINSFAAGADKAGHRAFKTGDVLDQTSAIAEIGASTLTALESPSHQNHLCRCTDCKCRRRAIDTLASEIGERNEIPAVAEEASRAWASNDHMDRSLSRRDSSLSSSVSEHTSNSLTIRANTHHAPSILTMADGQLLVYHSRSETDGRDTRTKFIFPENFNGDERVMNDQMKAEAMIALLYLRDKPTLSKNEDGLFTVGEKALELKFQVGWANRRTNAKANVQLAGAIQFSRMTGAEATWLLSWYKIRGSGAEGIRTRSIILTSDSSTTQYSVSRKMESYNKAPNAPRDCRDAFAAGVTDSKDLDSGSNPLTHPYIDTIAQGEVIGFYSPGSNPTKNKVKFVFSDSFEGNKDRMSEQMCAEAANALVKLQEKPIRHKKNEGSRVLKMPYDVAWALKTDVPQEDRGSILFRGMTKRQAEYLLRWFRERDPEKELIPASDGIQSVTMNFIRYPVTVRTSRTVVDAFAVGAGVDYEDSGNDKFEFVDKNPLNSHEANDEHSQSEYSTDDEVDEIMDDRPDTQLDTGARVIGYWSLPGKAKFIFPHTFGGDSKQMITRMLGEYAFALQFLMELEGGINHEIPFRIGWTHVYSNGVPTPVGSIEYVNMELQWAQFLQHWYKDRAVSIQGIMFPLETLQLFGVLDDMPTEMQMINYPATRDLRIVDDVQIDQFMHGIKSKRDDSNLTSLNTTQPVHTVYKVR